MSDDLVKRLRGIADWQELNAPYDCQDDSKELREAADRIEALQAEVRELALQVLASDGQAAESLERALKAEAESARLRQALESMFAPSQHLHDPRFENTIRAVLFGETNHD